VRSTTASWFVIVRVRALVRVVRVLTESVCCLECGLGCGGHWACARSAGPHECLLAVLRSWQWLLWQQGAWLRVLAGPSKRVLQSIACAPLVVRCRTLRHCYYNWCCGQQQREPGIDTRSGCLW
jgi:hypothetical protein